MEFPSGSEGKGDCGRNMSRSSTPEIESEIAKLKGDAIGDTLYSERWVLGQLIELMKCASGELSSKVEDELCLLWDMTVEEDVVKFLLKHDFLTIACQCLKPSTPPRVTEIVVGILGNVCRTADARRALAVHNGLQAVLMDLLPSSDPHILLQLLRLLSTCIWHIDKYGDSNFSCGMRSWLVSNKEQFNQLLPFILSNSLNGELLACTLELLHNLFSVTNGNDPLCAEFATTEMVTGLMEAARQFMSSLERDDEMKPMWTKDVEKAMEHWSGILDLFVSSERGMAMLNDSSDLVNAIVDVLNALGECESPKVLSEHKWQLLSSIANTLRGIGERFGTAPLPVLVPILRLLPRLPKLASEASHVASFDDDEEVVGMDEKDEFVGFRASIVSYCADLLSLLTSEDLSRISNKNATVSFVELRELLQNTSDEGIQKLATLLPNAEMKTD